MDFILAWLQQNTWMLEIFGVILATLIGRFVLKVVLDALGRRLTSTATPYDEAFLEVVRKPLGWAIWILGILWAAEIARDQVWLSEGIDTAPEDSIFNIIDEIRQVSIIALLAWFAARFTHRVAQFVEENQENADDKHTITVIAKLVRVSILITAFLITLQALGVSVAGVLAFGGIGGIAVGFAARDLLANFFGAFMILLDKPFRVGDWIRSPDKEIEGTVEQIGWRLTCIRTFDKRPLYVPNSTFATLTVENPSRMLNRRIKETIGVRYDDVQLLPKILEDIRSMLQNHEEIDTNQILMVNFNYFGPSSVDFFIYTMTKTTDWAHFHTVKEDVLLRISNIITSHGAEIAFPTQTLHVENVPLVSTSAT